MGQTQTLVPLGKSDAETALVDRHQPTQKGPAVCLWLLNRLASLKLIWLFTESNFSTFVLPNTTFGILGALAGSNLIDGPTLFTVEILQRLPLVVFFNWYSVFIFDLANQRSPESVLEDQINKPWRPIPQGIITARQTQTLQLVSVPVILLLNWLLGVWHEGLLINILVWLYNELRGGDGLARDPIIAIAFGLFNHTSLRLASGADAAAISMRGLQWIGVVSGIILTTMQVQDLKDQAGDRSRDRQTIPLVLGDGVSRAMVAIAVPLWSGLCCYLWKLPLLLYLPPFLLSMQIARRLLYLRKSSADATTWRLWCLWTAVIYSAPLASNFAARHSYLG